MNGIVANEPVGAFDFNGNGGTNFAHLQVF